MAEETAQKHNNIQNALIVTEHDGNTTSERCVFHTPTILEKVNAAIAESNITISLIMPDGTEKKLTSGTKSKVVADVAKATISNDAVARELYKFAQFIINHSNVRGIGMHGVIRDEESDKANGFGFIMTAHDCTAAEAIFCVNCGEANIDKFLKTTHLSVPGREKTEEDGQVIVA